MNRRPLTVRDPPYSRRPYLVDLAGVVLIQFGNNRPLLC